MCDNVHSINVCKHSILHLTDSPIFGQEGLVAKPKLVRARTVGKNFQLFSICTSPITHLVCPSKFCITFGFHFSWVLVQPFREELKTMLMQNFEGGGGRGANKVNFGTGDVQVANYLSMEDIK